MQKAYGVKLLKNFWLTGYFEGEDLADNISEDVQWKVPYKRSDGECGIATFAQQDGEYVWLGESIGEQQEKMPASKGDIAEIIAQTGITSDDILTTDFLYSQMYKLVLIYITTGENEYFIPYAEFPELLQSTDQRYQVVNGKIYEISDFMKEMNQIFDEKYLFLHPEESTGLRYRQHVSMRWIIVFGGVAAIGIAGCFLRKHKRKLIELKTKG